MQLFRMFSIIFTALLVVASCGTPNVKPEVKLDPTLVAQRAVEAKKTARRKATEERIQKLLNQAESALLQGRLTVPVSDNAYDRFRAVSMLDASNADAQRGMHRVLLAYIVRIHQSLSAGHIDRAKVMIERVKEYYPDDPLTLGLIEKVKQADTDLIKEQAHSMQASIDSGERVMLSRVLLSERGDAIKAALLQIAQRVQQSNESVMIYARSDSEGRWIYQTMKKAAEGYRIRGDIRINKIPSIMLQKPIQEEAM